MVVPKIKLVFCLVAFIAVFLLSKVSGDDSLILIQKNCKTQSDAVRDQKKAGEDSCPAYKTLVQCIARVNFTAVDSFVSSQNEDNCEFSDEELRDLQKYKNPSTKTTTMTEKPEMTPASNSPAGPTMMISLLAIVIVLPALCF